MTDTVEGIMALADEQNKTFFLYMKEGAAAYAPAYHDARAALRAAVERVIRERDRAISQRQQAIVTAADHHAMYQDARNRMYAAEAERDALKGLLREAQEMGMRGMQPRDWELLDRIDAALEKK